jgi:hypothetical protein
MMTFKKRRPTGARIVEDGQVSCPRSGMGVDVEECYGCRLLGSLGGNEDETWVTCRLRDLDSAMFLS